jgi:hypothetical protein
MASTAKTGKAQYLAAMMVELDAPEPGCRLVEPNFEYDFLGGGRCTAGMARHRTSDDGLDNVVVGNFGYRHVKDYATIPENRDSIADLPNLIEPVRDVEHADAIEFETTDDGE